VASSGWVEVDASLPPAVATAAASHLLTTTSCSRTIFPSPRDLSSLFFSFFHFSFYFKIALQNMHKNLVSKHNSLPKMLILSKVLGEMQSHFPKVEPNGALVG